ncbi:hypothetical protein OA526_03580 [Gammaproteobacteria bacterium]|nr:hypothetical protein [Gammaproteobacteria bacterium]
MQLFFKTFLISFFLYSCSSEIDKGIEANLLISPDYNFSVELFECELNETYTLLNLESFLSDLVKSDNYQNDDYDLEIFFPKPNYVNEFMLTLKTYSDNDNYNDFINQLSTKGFDEIARCKFNKNDYNGLVLIDQEIQENKYVNELLRCNYNKGFNFGTFRVAIDRFKNQMNSLNIAYEAVYLQTNKSPRSFIWINNFYSNEPSELIPSDWLSNEESQEIRQEFLDNANCIDAKMHDVFVLTNNYKK